MCMSSLSVLLNNIVDVPSVFDVALHGLTTDSREVKPGDVFVAVSGARTSADHYIEDAIAAGAVVILLETVEAQGCYEQHGALIVSVPELKRKLGVIADRFYRSPSSEMDVIGVTGTNGKTSVTHYLSQLLSFAGHTCGVIGTLGYGVGGQMTASTHTTPDVVRINRALRRIRVSGGKAVAMEVSSHALDQGRVDDISIRGAIFTNLTRDHLDYHGTMDAYGEAKKLLFRRDGLEFAVINFDDPFGRQLYDQLEGECDRIRYSLHEPQTELWLKSLRTHADGFDAQFDGKWGLIDVSAPLMGSFNISNLLAAMAAALQLGVSIDDVQAGARRLIPPPGRLERFAGASGVSVVVDYAHTPDALSNALEALKPHVEGRLWCVFGCGGDRDSGKRPEMATIAEKLADRVVVTDDNPRSEEPGAIVDQIMTGFSRPEVAQVVHDREAAIRQAVFEAAPGDVVLVAGKGHETYQEIRGERFDFSDAGVVRQALVDREGER
ncbi:UDP-N-acetylmuramoyl-L-alanyl-D-glutamate--2,6-diaminopimelate ligase [Marinobacter nanhaiticus D15-8W]|uniref:UDP-N-acetylmuramoyl-L-alanyl-D-glutamate--2,6-diaminopimelate ligase n=1 Tax=Marinobacter nanhaiticus D15-8W TaxID=626887 RepID=N6WZ87_9GAMM|nr:UDP-N-acetylmuramoyl-L-alanyl-D-glutamate--2,6-diaminopimelate ligase [Marinobacter nanhaiticus]ENO16866.1 UDP-N-acetylmuramoyl-L-alanyl-D-glutamate--2,6-diaminopimelate ligase [Marinobacter nanhaiticus D15-8W]BES72683.1 UDP-N-acetylmuramoyl-L-alanyl-D-glutamate--2,6-diaminopimelate ligase [Marinobacter nanhaiticus D15-8W]